MSSLTPTASSSSSTDILRPLDVYVIHTNLQDKFQNIASEETVCESHYSGDTFYAFLDGLIEFLLDDDVGVPRVEKIANVTQETKEYVRLFLQKRELYTPGETDESFIDDFCWNAWKFLYQYVKVLAEATQKSRSNPVELKIIGVYKNDTIVLAERRDAYRILARDAHTGGGG